jgi:hypothetical protein
MPEIPEQLKWYIPLKSFSKTSGPVSWCVSVDEMTGCIEIKRVPYIRLFWVITGFIAAAIFSSPAYYTLYTSGLPRNGFDWAFIVIFGIIVPLGMIVFMPAVGAFCVMMDSNHWNGPLRFRFNPQNGELFFAKEKATYRPEDYSQLVLCCVYGTDMEDAYMSRGKWYPRSSKYSPPKDSTQIFMLILDKNDQWKRYLLADDSISFSWGRKRFLKIVDRLQSFLSFEQFDKNYSFDECYEQQKKG